ncbi:helix-turn-helix transcriptional regulator [Clostridiaceae bacterium NSJ-33]|uniref:Helix-turn-helix transcriptional regulator n=2 Tax=Fumia xinanensis TaxID=2763659 RepID=A0A926E2V0_9FIRM|nr:helix-turn-helix transcriptional regulator [Fumia xinanensis]
MTLHRLIVNRIQGLCDEKGISINKMAKICGVTQSTIDNIMKGNSINPKIETIFNICNGMGLTLGEFFGTADFDALKQ